MGDACFDHVGLHIRRYLGGGQVYSSVADEHIEAEAVPAEVADKDTNALQGCEVKVHDSVC